MASPILGRRSFCGRGNVASERRDRNADHTNAPNGSGALGQRGDLGNLWFLRFRTRIAARQLKSSDPDQTKVSPTTVTSRKSRVLSCLADELSGTTGIRQG